ncbi:ATP-binding cassette domain-containing protein [bacterium]|nr:ATP-binding cassette domain-containing protein [bacterium]
MLLEARELTKRYGEQTVVDAVSFDLEAGDALALIGPSGCGKTTTLKMINRLVEPDAGEVRLGGRSARQTPAHEWRRRIGYVIQSSGLFPHRSVAENISVTPHLLGWEKRRIAAKVEALLDMVGLDPADYADRAPADLSGGQRQRVGLARALAGEPDLLLMDEPFAALDPVTKDALIEDIIRLRERLKFAAVIVTHDFSEALRLAGRVAVMDGGRIAQIGPVCELIAAPATDTVRALLDAPRRTARAVASAFAGSLEGPTAVSTLGAGQGAGVGARLGAGE